MASGPAAEKNPSLTGVDPADVVPPESAGAPQTSEAPDSADSDTRPAEHSKTKRSPLNELFDLEANAPIEKIRELIDSHVKWKFGDSKIAGQYTLLVLHDVVAINRTDADRIYRGLDGADRKQPILLILNSPGGDVAAAYFIGKLCRENTDASFQVAIPRQAKSAATLVSCAADRIHMGSLSELGPIDPQIRRMPALAVKHSLEHLSELVTQYPDARGMLSDYLAQSMPIEVLGYYERAAHSAVQYAERLLGLRRGVISALEDSEIARKLVYDYKDHGFAIDCAEATSIFGSSVVARNSPEYDLANEVYQIVDFLTWFVDARFGQAFSYTGALGKGAWVRPKS